MYIYMLRWCMYIELRWIDIHVEIDRWAIFYRRTVCLPACVLGIGVSICTKSPKYPESAIHHTSAK